MGKNYCHEKQSLNKQAKTGQNKSDIKKQKTEELHDMMLSYKFRLYPNKSVEKTGRKLGIASWLYNRLLEEISKARKEGRKITQKDTQALIVRLKKEEKPELKKVYSKALQMVNYQLCYGAM